MSNIDRIREKQIARIDELATFGVSAKFGPWAGAITLLAGDTDKLLRLLRRLKRLESTTK